MKLSTYFPVWLALMALPAFVEGCGCGDDHVDVKSTGGPKGGTTPDAGTIDNDPLGPIVLNGLDPKTCVNDVTAPVVEPPIYVKPPIASGDGTRPLAILVWSFCDSGRNDLPVQPNYKMLVSPHNLVVGQETADRDCTIRPSGVQGFPSKCFPPIPGNDKSITIQLPALASCQCHSEIVFINVPSDQEASLSTRPPTQRLTLPTGDYHFTLSSPWDVTILDQEVSLQ